MKPEIQSVQDGLERHGYIADPAIATAVFLSREMRKPLLVEGDAGVGKTEIAKVLARLLDTELIRLQCYEGSTSTPRSTSGTISARCCARGSPSRKERARSEVEDLDLQPRLSARAAAAPARSPGARGRRCC